MNNEVDFYFKSRRKFLKLKPEKRESLSCNKVLLIFEKCWVVIALSLLVISLLGFVASLVLEKYFSQNSDSLLMFYSGSFMLFIFFSAFIYLINEVKIYSKMKRKISIKTNEKK